MDTIEALLRDPAWLRAATLEERLRGLPQDRCTELPRGERRARVDRRLARWLSQPPFENREILARRLAADGLDEDSLRSLLGFDDEDLRRRFPRPPQWLASFAEVFTSVREAGPPPAWPEDALRDPLTAFLKLVEPWIRWARRRLVPALEALALRKAPLPDDPLAVERLLLDALRRRVLPMLGRSLALELHAARLEERLPGDDPETRFQAFVEELGDPQRVLAILREYPVLARQITVAVETWLESSLEALERLAADAAALAGEWANGGGLGILERFDSGAGDPHRGGRTVSLLRFSSGLSVVYKPKSLAVDLGFQELVKWFGQHGLDPPLRPLRILDRGTYGWVEHVAARPCRSAEDVDRFFRRQGFYLALFYALEAIDFHYQNLIAHGEHPMPVDFEALFHANVERAEISGPDQLARRRMVHSVLRIGLLPMPRWFDPEEAEARLDMSALGASGRPPGSRAVPVAEAAGSDTMRFVRRRLPMDAGLHRAVLDGREVSPADHLPAILDGFTKAYRLLMRHREALLRPGGPLDAFADAEVRLILRASRIYSTLHGESYHPQLLRDGLDRERFFDHLWIDVDRQPNLERVIRYERRDLWREDVPLFVTRPGSRHVWTSQGERLPHFFQESGLDLVRRRLEHLDEDDLEQQRWFIEASVATLTPRREGRADPRQVRPTLRTAPLPASAEALAQARALGERLRDRALYNGTTATWVGLLRQPDGRYTIEPLVPDLHFGLSGVAVFLARLAALTGEPEFDTLGRAAWRHAEAQLASPEVPMTAIGAFYGWGSLIYAALHLADLWQDESLWQQAEHWVEEVAVHLDADGDLDVIGGAAGAILALLRLHALRPSERTLAVSVACGDHLLARARTMRHGTAWSTRLAPRRPLTGLSHGTAGFAWALAELGETTGQQRFLDTACQALVYERHTFSAERGDWPDLSFFDEEGNPETDESPNLFPAWCHGAAGIGLVRTRVRRIFPDDPELEHEMRTAVGLMFERGFGHGHALCHGDFGNLDILLHLADALGDAEGIRGRIGWQARAALAELCSYGPRCGTPGEVENPGLMTGLAGIGYGLLRLAAPDRVPSILTLQGPT